MIYLAKFKLVRRKYMADVSSTDELRLVDASDQAQAEEKLRKAVEKLDVYGLSFEADELNLSEMIS